MDRIENKVLTFSLITTDKVQRKIKNLNIKKTMQSSEVLFQHKLTERSWDVMIPVISISINLTNSHFLDCFKSVNIIQKQPSRDVLKKRCSENMQQNYRKTPMPKCDFNKDALQLHWNHTSAWLFSRRFAAYFQNTFS